MSHLFDVAIAGGGPAGAATALALAAHAPRLAVVLVEPSEYREPRVGETLPPAARPILAHLGVLEAFRRQGHVRVAGTAAAWGAAFAPPGDGRNCRPAPRENDYLFSLQGEGWHLDRARFDALLAEEARKRGAVLRTGRITRAARLDHGWRLALADGEDLRARFLVDATGAAAALARRQGARFAPLDRLAGYARFYDPPTGSRSHDPRTLVEAFADGWWYTAGLPGGRRVVACMTDPDLARRLGLADEDTWDRLLGSTTERIASLAAAAGAAGLLVVRTAQSRRLEPAAAGGPGRPGWLAVGDAASLLDPLSSAGITKALRSGVYAAYAIADHLLKEDPLALARYRRFVATEFAAFAEHRARVYAEELRWPESEFWRRRAG